MTFRNVHRLGSVIVAAALATPSAQVLPQAAWEVVGELDSPVGSGVVVPLPAAQALLTGSDGQDPLTVYLYEPASGFARVADAPSPLQEHFAAALHDGRVLVGGGGNFFDRDLLTDRCFIYDPETDSWSEAAPLPSPSFYLYGNTAVTLPDGRVLVTGGSTPAEAYFDPSVEVDLYLASRNVFLFDPNSETVLPDGRVLPGEWTVGASMPATRVFATHAPAFSSQVGVPLGAENTPPKGAASGRVAHEMVVIPDGRVLLVGGREYNPGWFYGITPVDAYDPATNTWTRLAELPGVPSDGDGGYGGRSFPGVTILESGEVLIFGGRAIQLVEKGRDNGQVIFEPTGPGGLPRQSSLLFDPVTSEFQRVGDLNVRRFVPLAVAWPEGGGAFAIGGTSVGFSGMPVPEAEVYDPTSAAWSLLPIEPQAATDFSPRNGALLTDGTVLTWSDLPFFVESGLRAVKRLHPMGLPPS